MARGVDLGDKREGVQPANEQEVLLAKLDASILRGVADADDGRVHELETVLDALNKKWAN